MHRTWRLNERHYGALEGRRREEIRARYGDALFAAWRRSFDTPPPPAERTAADPRYAALDVTVPASESLADVTARLLPYWEAGLAAYLRAGRTVLVVAHGNVLRALIAHLEQIPPNGLRDIAVPTGEPLRYELTDDALPTGPHRPVQPGRT